MYEYYYPSIVELESMRCIDILRSILENLYLTYKYNQEINSYFDDPADYEINWIKSDSLDALMDSTKNLVSSCSIETKFDYEMFNQFFKFYDNFKSYIFASTWHLATDGANPRFVGYAWKLAEHKIDFLMRKYQ